MMDVMSLVVEGEDLGSVPRWTSQEAKHCRAHDCSDKRLDENPYTDSSKCGTSTLAWPFSKKESPFCTRRHTPISGHRSAEPHTPILTSPLKNKGLSRKPALDLGIWEKEGIGQRPRATATPCRTTWPPVRGPRAGSVRRSPTAHTCSPPECPMLSV